MLRKLANDLLQMRRVCGTRTTARFATNALLASPAILKERTLAAADARMNRTIYANYRGSTVVIPVTEIQAESPSDDKSSAFSGVREVLLRQVYFRFLKPEARFATAVDLGANRGFVSTVLARCFGATKVIGVEPRAEFSNCFDVLRRANALSAAQSVRIPMLAVGCSSPGITIDTLMTENHLEVLSLLKMDIEGGESDIFSPDAPKEYLRVTKNVIAELHPRLGVNTESIERTLRSSGFQVHLTDDDGRSARFDDATYLYATREPGLWQPSTFR
ncbi:MAG: FkbM family methyltransferase [Myxococcota bacterium]